MADFGTAFGFFGGAIGDLFAAQGFSQAAGGYEAAARMSDVNANLSLANMRIQQAATQREIYRAIGGQRSDVLGSGFSFTGTALDLAADSVAQGGIAQALIQTQGQIETQGYRIEAFTYRQKAAEARSAAAGSTVSGIFGIIGGILSIFSDRHLKYNIKSIGKDDRGFNKYEFSYIGSKDRWVGYMADELPEGAVSLATGFATIIDDTFKAVPLHAD